MQYPTEPSGKTGILREVGPLGQGPDRLAPAPACPAGPAGV
jgi:hypothetical protein